MTIVNIGPNITLGGRAKACKIIGCNSEWSPKRGDLTNQKRLAVYACANRDFSQDFCHHGDTICHPKSSYVTTKLNGMSTCGCNNNAICSDKAIFTFPTVDVCRPR